MVKRVPRGSNLEAEGGAELQARAAHGACALPKCQPAALQRQRPFHNKPRPGAAAPDAPAAAMLSNA